MKVSLKQSVQVFILYQGECFWQVQTLTLWSW